MRALSHVPQRPAVTVFMLFVLGLAFIAPLVPQQTVRAAATEVVVNTNDAGPGSLRQAIADVDAGGDITFDIAGTGPHTINLTSGQLSIAKSLTISDPGANGIIIDAGGTSRVVFIADETTVSIDGLTISGGFTSSSGSGIYAGGGTLTITNSTISGNSASGNSAASGGGIYAGGGTLLTITNSTISGNSATRGGGILFGSAILTATIVANNPSGGNCSGDHTSGGYNLSTDGTCFSSGGTDLLNTNPMLGGLADNGGPTMTHALPDGSPAIDHIPEANCPAGIDVDQRGIERPQGPGCDIGAFEFEPEPTAPILSLPVEPITVEATGPTGAAVPFEVSATDWTGATIPVTCEVASEAVVSGDTFPLGDTLVECSTTDSLEQTTEGSFTITVEDTTDPTISVPDDMTLYTTDPDGVVVDFIDEVSASDTVDPTPEVACIPASGDTFVAGPTEVECTATDDADNVATGSFTITVIIDSGQLLAGLARDVRDLDLPFWDEFGLLVLIGVAGNLAGDSHATASCRFLELFNTRIASLVPETISPADAEQLSEDAREVQAVLGCAPDR